MSDELKIPLPVNIGLIGAPGSGKEKLGELFFERANTFFATNGSELRVLQNAGRTIEKEFDYPMGMFGSYVDDLRAYWVRQVGEEAAQKDGVSYLTLGTAIDHIAHTGINLETIMTGLTTPDQEVKQQRWQVTMTMLTMLFQEQFRYTFGFYLPYEGTEIVVPGAEVDTEAEYNKRIDAGLRMVFANFGMRLQVLDQPSLEEKADVMFETIQTILTNGPEPTPPDEDTPDVEPVANESEEAETEEDPSTEAGIVPVHA